MCDLCKLTDESKDGFIITICDTCKTKLIISREHKPEFSADEMLKIVNMFYGHKIRWEQRKIHDHAHCHILGLEVDFGTT